MKFIWWFLIFSFENDLNILKKLKNFIKYLFGIGDRKQIPKLHLNIKFKNYKELLDRNRFIR